MDRIINVKVGGNHLSKDSKNAGVRGEANVTKLRITFDEGWDGYAKTVTFFDAHGNNPVKRIQGVDLIEDIINDTRTYITPIPQEPLAIAGELTFVIDGYLDGKRQRSLTDKLVVKDAPDTDNAGEPTDPTPTQAEQLQSQIDAVIGDIQNSAVSEKNAKGYADLAMEYRNQASQSQNQAKVYAEQANKAETDAYEQAERAEQNANDAEASRMAALMAQDKAEEALTHNPIIVDGYWHVWNAQTEEYVDTGVKAQSGSEVYIGVKPPATADVIIDLEGESAIYAPYIGANGNWYTFNPETQTFTDSGNCAVGKDGCTPIKGADYFTEDDIKELEKCVIEAASDDLNQANESAIDAKTSADNAAASEKTASQALSDLLAMINSGDLVLATGGKLPLSSIPATATQEIYTVTSEDELTSLTAQRGDLAELVEEIDGERTITKTWQCLGDASVRENWVVWGTSYAVQAGNSTTADNALSANMINNHRLVEMSEEEFASAVKDADTYYLVY